MDLLKFIDEVKLNDKKGILTMKYFGMNGILVLDNDLVKDECGYYIKEQNTFLLSTRDFRRLVFKTSDFDEAVKFLANKLLQRIYNTIDYRFSKLNIKELPK